MQVIGDLAFGMGSAKKGGSSTLTYAADTHQPISRQAADAFKARVHAFRVGNRADNAQSGDAGNCGPNANTPVAISQRPDVAQPRSLNGSAECPGPTSNLGMPQNVAQSTPRGPLSQIWAEALETGTNIHRRQERSRVC